MLVINESNRRLLNMKAKLLEVSGDNDSGILEDYKKLAKDIDNDCYNQIVNKIKNCDYNDLSLEEQIVFLSEIEADYNYLNELQWISRNTYNKYADEDIELCNIDNILIDNIISRISDIHGYLMNIKNLDSNKKEVDRLNSNLISLEKEKEQIKRLINDIRSKLKNDIVAAEGRIYGANGSLVPVSINSELKRYDVNLNQILNDSLKLGNVYKAFSEEEKMLEEKYKVTIDLPKRDEEICHQIEIDMINGKYKLALVQLIREISTDDNEYSSFKDRLYRIAQVIDNLKDCSQKLGIRFYINPFDRIKINSQIQVINSIKDVDKEIANIKKTIIYITSMIDNATDKNNELIKLINTDIDIIREDIDQDLIVEDKTNYDDVDKTFSDIILDNRVKDNQVIKIDDFKDGFMIGRAHEKTNGVIKRVFEMISSVPVISQNIESPELVLEPVKEEIIVPYDEKQQDEDIFPLFNDESEISFSSDLDTQNTNLENLKVNEEKTNDKVIDSDVIMEDQKVPFPQSNESVENLVHDNSDSIFLDSPHEDNNQIFREITPFEEAPIFSDKYDTGVFEEQPKMVLDLGSEKVNSNFENNNVIHFDNTKKEDVLSSMMPDAFWVTKDEKIKDTHEEPLSIDQQVAKMMRDTDQIKTMKKVA